MALLHDVVTHNYNSRKHFKTLVSVKIAGHSVLYVQGWADPSFRGGPPAAQFSSSISGDPGQVHNCGSEPGRGRPLTAAQAAAAGRAHIPESAVVRPRAVPWKTEKIRLATPRPE